MTIPDIAFYIFSFLCGAGIGVLGTLKYIEHKTKKQMQKMQDQLGAGMLGGDKE